MSYWIWVPLVIADYILCAYLTHKNNLHGGAWFYFMWGMGFLPLWAFVCKYSKNVVFDGMLFDVLMTITYTLSILYFTKSFEKLGATQYIGLGTILCGLYLFKRGV